MNFSFRVLLSYRLFQFVIIAQASKQLAFQSNSTQRGHIGVGIFSGPTIQFILIVSFIIFKFQFKCIMKCEGNSAPNLQTAKMKMAYCATRTRYLTVILSVDSSTIKEHCYVQTTLKLIFLVVVGQRYFVHIFEEYLHFVRSQLIFRRYSKFSSICLINLTKWLKKVMGISCYGPPMIFTFISFLKSSCSSEWLLQR